MIRRSSPELNTKSRSSQMAVRNGQKGAAGLAGGEKARLAPAHTNLCLFLFRSFYRSSYSSTNASLYA